MAKKKTSKKPSAKKESPKVRVTLFEDRVLVKEIEEQNKKTESGIIIPDSVKDGGSTKLGLVMAVGKGKTEDGKLVPMNVSVGDKVFYGWGSDVVIDGEEYTVVKESEVIGKL